MRLPRYFLAPSSLRISLSQIHLRRDRELIENVLNRCVGLVIGSFDLAARLLLLVWPPIKQAVRQRSTRQLVDYYNQQTDKGVCVGEPIAVTFALSFQ